MPKQAKRQRKKEGRAVRQAALAAARRRESRRRSAVTLLVFFVIVGLVAVFIGQSTSDDEDTQASTTDTTTTTVARKQGTAPCPAPDGSSPQMRAFDGVPPMCIDPAKTYTATIETDAGPVVAVLDAGKAPKTVNNFVFLARYHLFDALTFHRVVTGFVDQGGDPEGTGNGGPGYQFDDELPAAPSDYKAGSLAMANSGPNTNGSQFFILTSDAAAKQLVDAVEGRAAYSLFGQVTQGMDVVERINADGSPKGLPNVVHTTTKVTITES